MGTTRKGSRLGESFETVYGEPTIRQMFAGKAVSRSLRGYFFVEAGLMTKLLRYLFPTDYSYFQEKAELLTDEEQNNEDDLRDIEFREDDDLPNTFPNNLTHDIVIEEVDIL